MPEGIVWYQSTSDGPGYKTQRQGGNETTKVHSDPSHPPGLIVAIPGYGRVARAAGRRSARRPGLILARRLKRKAAQVWLFATRFDVPATNNGSENAIRGYKLAAKISGCWRTLATLQRHCRIRSYLTTARSHGRHPLAAIRDALTGNPWMPLRPA